MFDFVRKVICFCINRRNYIALVDNTKIDNPPTFSADSQHSSTHEVDGGMNSGSSDSISSSIGVAPIDLAESYDKMIKLLKIKRENPAHHSEEAISEALGFLMAEKQKYLSKKVAAR